MGDGGGQVSVVAGGRGHGGESGRSPLPCEGAWRAALGIFGGGGDGLPLHLPLGNE